MKREGVWELLAGWDIAPLGCLVDSQSGFACSKKNLVSASMGVAHLRPFNVGTDGRVDLSEVYYVPPDFKDDVEDYALEPGHILFNNTNSVELVGKTALVTQPMSCAFSNHIYRLALQEKAKKRLEPAWLALALRRLWAMGYFAEQCNRWIGQAGFNATKLKEVEIPLPSLDEQRRILARIEALFEHIAEARRLRVAAEEDAERLMPAALEEVFAEPGPEWETSDLSDIAFVQTGTAKGRRFGNRKTMELPYLRVANVQAGYLMLDEIKTIRIAADETDRYLLQPGDLLLTEGGDFDKLGRGAVWSGEIESCVHQNHIFAVRFDQSKVLPRFAEYEMQSWYAKTYFLQSAKRTTNLASINKTQLSAFPFLHPPLIPTAY